MKWYDLQDLLPEVYAKIASMYAASVTENEELKQLDAQSTRLYRNFFIQLCDAQTLQYWEEILDIPVDVELDSDVRRQRIINELSTKQAITIGFVRKVMRDLFGDGNYTFKYSETSNLVLEVEVRNSELERIEYFMKWFTKVCPAHIQWTLDHVEPIDCNVKCFLGVVNENTSMFEMTYQGDGGDDDMYSLQRNGTKVELLDDGAVVSSIDIADIINDAVNYSLERSGSNIELKNNGVLGTSVDVEEALETGFATDFVTTNKINVNPRDGLTETNSTNPFGVIGNPVIVSRGTNKEPILIVPVGDIILVKGSSSLENLMGGATAIHVGDQFIVSNAVANSGNGVYLAASKDGLFVEASDVDSKSKAFIGAGTYVALSSASLTDHKSVVLVKKLA